VQGIGWALNEEYIYDSKGRLENPGFLDYRIPVASDLPMIEPVMVEGAESGSPLWRQGRRRGQHLSAYGCHRKCDRACGRPAANRASDVAAKSARGDRRMLRRVGSLQLDEGTKRGQISCESLF